MTRMTALPDGFSLCTWCKHGVRLPDDGVCPNCHMTNAPTAVKATPKGPSKRSLKAGRIVPLDPTPVGQPVLGIDPGYRYSAVVLRDGDAVLHATTLVRDKDLKDPVPWARLVIEEIKLILFSGCPPGTRLAVEGVSAPKGFSGGEKRPLDPKFILFTGVVLGAVVGTWPDAAVVDPGGNGSQHISHYPPELAGRRPPTLPGSDNKAGTREHTRSAYDVAGKAAKTLYPRTPNPLEIT